VCLAASTSVTFLTPGGALLGLAALVPLLALLLARAAGSKARGLARLPEPRARTLALPVAALALTAALLALAASRPVLERTEDRRVRTDAEAIFVLDTTRSMLARGAPSGTQRIARAKAAAAKIRAALPGIPSGLASLTDRMLPHLFPSADEDVFRRTLARAIGIERPPPQAGFSTNVTRLEALSAAAKYGFFSDTATHRLLVVLSDGETLPEQSPEIGVLFRRPPGVRTVFVHTWAPGEKVFRGLVPEPAYRSDPTAPDLVRALAGQVGGEVFREGDLAGAERAARAALGTGATVVRGERRWHVALAPFLVAAAFAPLLVLLWRRDR